jgi:hypothetical protein
VISSTLNMFCLLEEGLSIGLVSRLSDIGVGFAFVVAIFYVGWGARYCYVAVYDPRSSINTFNVDCSSYTSSFS